MDFEQAKEARRQRQLTVTIGLIAAATLFVAWFGLLNFFASGTPEETAVEPTTASSATPSQRRESATDSTAACTDPASSAPECVARRNALRIWSDASDLAEDLNERNAAEWATLPFAQAVSDFASAAQLFEDNAFVEAETAFTDALTQFRQVEQLGRETFDTAMRDGWAALDSEATQDAIAAFEQALAVDPRSDRAQEGLQQARTQGDMLDLYYRGLVARSESRLDDARSLLEQAAALDPDNTKARDALGSVIGDIRANNYRSRLSVGFRALESGDGARARDAFTQALAIRPGSAEATSGLQQAEALERSQSLKQLIANADELAAREMWEAARAMYAQALDLDPTVQTAIDGQANLDRLLELERQMDDLIARPFRMSSTAVFQFAENVIADSLLYADASPRLSAKTTQLTQLMQDMQTPVQLTLRSDGRTAVSIQRVGDIGRFEEKILDVLPGSYVVTGARAGYRDVREDFDVRPGSSPITLTVICRDEF